MAKVVLVAGNSKRFWREVAVLRNFLEESVGLKDIVCIRTAYLDEDEVAKLLERAIGRETVFLAYAGHGGPDGWSLNDAHTLRYEILTAILAAHSPRLLFLNDCCHAMSVESFLEKVGVSQEEVKPTPIVKTINY